MNANSEIEIVTTYTGNGEPSPKPLPRILLLAKNVNDVALAFVKKNTGLEFTPTAWNGYEAQPVTSDQIVKLFMTWNLKTNYYNNCTYSNTLVVKFDHHVGFDVDSICYDCCKENNISVNGLVPGDRLAC